MPLLIDDGSVIIGVPAAAALVREFLLEVLLIPLWQIYELPWLQASVHQAPTAQSSSRKGPMKKRKKNAEISNVLFLGGNALSKGIRVRALTLQALVRLFLAGSLKYPETRDKPENKDVNEILALSQTVGALIDGTEDAELAISFLIGRTRSSLRYAARWMECIVFDPFGSRLPEITQRLYEDMGILMPLDNMDVAPILSWKSEKKDSKPSSSGAVRNAFSDLLLPDDELTAGLPEADRPLFAKLNSAPILDAKVVEGIQTAATAVQPTSIGSISAPTEGFAGISTGIALSLHASRASVAGGARASSSARTPTSFAGLIVSSTSPSALSGGLGSAAMDKMEILASFNIRDEQYHLHQDDTLPWDAHRGVERKGLTGLTPCTLVTDTDSRCGLLPRSAHGGVEPKRRFGAAAFFAEAPTQMLSSFSTSLEKTTQKPPPLLNRDTITAASISQKTRIVSISSALSHSSTTSVSTGRPSDQHLMGSNTRASKPAGPPAVLTSSFIAPHNLVRSLSSGHVAGGSYSSSGNGTQGSTFIRGNSGTGAAVLARGESALESAALALRTNGSGSAR
jgi:hypothetical protein